MNILGVFSEINYWAVLVAGIIHMATGLVWYQPGLFGKAWMQLTGKDLNPAKQWLPAGFVGHMLIALVLAVVIVLARGTTIIDGIIAAVLVWLGFIVTLETGELIWEKIPFKLFLIRIAEHLLSLSLGGIILALWR